MFLLITSTIIDAPVKKITKYRSLTKSDILILTIRVNYQ